MVMNRLHKNDKRLMVKKRGRINGCVLFEASKIDERFKVKVINEWLKRHIQMRKEMPKRK